MENKTIYIEAQRLFRKQKHGMDIVALELLLRLKKASLKYSISVVTKQDEDVCLESANGFALQILKSSFYPFWEQWTLPKFAAKQPKNLLHCTGNTAPLWGKNSLVITLHDLIFLEENYLFKKAGGSLYQRLGNAYRRFVVPGVVKRAKHIITVSEFQRNLIMRKLQVPPEKISVVYNGTAEKFFLAATTLEIENACKKYNIDSSPYIFFFANTEPRKNTEAALKAFAIFCRENPQYDHKLVIKGLTQKQLNKKIIFCKAEAVSNRIQRISYITSDDLPMLYQGADVLWFPSFTEGFGLPIIEAMAGGTPVITSNTSVMPEIAADAALYIDPYKPDELANQTKQLLGNDELRNFLIKKGKLRAAKFTWKNSLHQLEKVYDKLLD